MRVVGSQEVGPPDDLTEEEVAKLLPRSTTPTQDSESSNSPSNSSNSSTSLRYLRKHPSISQLLTRARSASGSSTSSDSSTETVRPSDLSRSSADLPLRTLPGGPRRNQHRRDLGTWDRTVDVVYHEDPRGAPGPDKSLDFERSVDLLLREHGKERSPELHGYFALPAALRFKIWEHVIEGNPGDKPVALNGSHWYKNAWRQGEFSTLRKALESLQPCLEVSFEFRADAMVSFLMTRRFHVIYDSCVGPRLNPLATKWADKYYPYMQDISLEISLDRYRFGTNEQAHLLGPSTTNVGRLIQNFVQVQLKRRSVSTLRSFVILCRRFYGKRRINSLLQGAEIFGDEYVYCPNKHLAICDPFKELRGLVDSVRVCGFSEPYTFSLIQSLFSIPPADKLKFHSYEVAPSTMWPQLEGQQAQVGEGDGSVKLQKCNELPDGRDEGPWGAVQLPAPVGGEAGTDWMEKQIWLRQVSVNK